MDRKNIWDLLENQEVDVFSEYCDLWTLFHEKKITEDRIGYSATFKKVVDENFLHFKKRGSIISYDKLLQVLKVRHPDEIFVDVKLEDLDLLIEVIVFMIFELLSLEVRGAETGMKFVLDSISSILKKTNQKIISLDDGKRIVVPDDEAVAMVADLILPDDEKLALEVLGYSHFSNKNNLVEKRKILQRLANYLEPRFNINKSDEIGFVLNNYYIRHGNERNKDNVEKLGDEETANLYDKLYRDILYYILEQEHNDFKGLIKELKKDL